MDAAFRRLVTRSCEVCGWRGEAVEHRTQAVGCLLCHAPTTVVKEELLVPFVPGKNGVAAALSRLGASKGGIRRAEGLTPGRRRDIARAAAVARWRRR
jgi:hypothetical protein